MNILDELYEEVFESDEFVNMYESDDVDSIMERMMEETRFEDIQDATVQNKKSGKLNKVRLIAIIGAAIVVAMALKRFLIKRNQKNVKLKKDKQIARYSDEIKHIDKWIEILKKDREELKKNKDLTEGELKSKENNINRTIKRLIELSKEIQKTIESSGDDVKYNSKDVDLMMKYNKDFINILKKFNYNIYEIEGGRIINE